MATLPRFQPGSKLILFFIVLLTYLVKPSDANADDFKIMKISPEGGFTFDAINSISEDKFGFIWFGSNSGVYRYNSVSTIKFINSPEDKSSLPGNIIRSLYRDKDDVLWIATNNGLCAFDYQCECFIRYQFHDVAGNPRGNNVYQVLQAKDNSYWMVDNTGFSSVNFKTSVVNYLPLPENQKNDLIRLAVFNKLDGRIWLGGESGGIYYCDYPYK